MAETHELRLKINAAAARSGAREFVAALSSIKTAIRQLDRDSNGVFTRLNKNLKDAGSSGRAKINIVDRTSLRNLQSYSKLAQDAIKSTANTSRSVANLAARMQALSSSYATARGQADAFASSVSRLNTQLSRQAGATMPRTAGVAPTAGGGGGGARAGADQAVVAQERIQRAVEQSRLSVERLTTQLMKLGGFQSIGNLGNAFRDFQRQVSNGSMSASEFSRAMGGMRSAITNTQTSLTTLSAKTRDQVSADRAAVKSANDRARALDAANAATNRAELETAKLINRLRAVGDARGIDTLNNAMMRLRTSMSGSVGSVQQVKNATNEFANATTRLKVGLAASEGAQMNQARSARQVAAGAASAAAQTKALERDMRSAAGAANAADKAFRNATGGMRGLENAFSGGFQAASLFRTALGSITLGTFTKSVFTAGDALQQFNITMEVASGSAEAAADDLQYINDVAARLGTNLSASRDAFSKFAVSAQIAGVSGDQTRQIFESVSTAMAVLGRGTDDQKLAFLALEQMMSKGVISAEELRRQLGERLPGAVNLMAKAVGVSTAELQKMLKAGELVSSEVLPKFARELDKTFGSQLSRTFNRAGSNLGRLQTEFTKLLEITANSGFLDTLSNEFRDLTSLMRSDDVREAAANLGRGLADAAALAGKAITYLITNIETIGTVVRNIIGAVIVAQFFKMGQAAFLGAQQTLVAVKAFQSLRVSSDASAVSLTRQGTAAGAAAAQNAKLAASAQLAATAGGRVGATMGVLGRVMGFLGGPVGIAIGALTLIPFLLNRVGEDATSASVEYEDAMRRMGTSTFYFIDRAKELRELNPFEQFTANIPLLREAQEAIADFVTNSDITSAMNEQFDVLAGLGGGTFGDAIGDLKKDFEELRSTVNVGEQAKKIAEIKDTIVELIIAGEGIEGVSDAFQALQDITIDGSRSILTANAILQEQGDIAGESGKQMTVLSANLAKLGQDMEGTSGEIVGSLDSVFLKLSEIGSTDLEIYALSTSMTTLATDFENTNASITETRNKIAELRAQFSAVAGDASLEQTVRAQAEEFLALLDAAEENIDGLEALRSQSAATSAEISALTSTIDGSKNAMNGATTAAYAMADGLDAIRDARAEVGRLTADFDVERAQEAEIAQLKANGQLREAAILTDAYSGATSRNVEALREQHAVALETLNGLTNTPQPDLPGFAADGLRAQAASEVAGLEAQIAEEMAKGATHAGIIFDLREQGKSSGGGSKEELTALQELTKAGGEHLLSLQAQDQANKLLASGMTKSAAAADMLGEAFANGVVLTNQQTMAFIAQIEAAEQLNRSLSELANDPVNDFMNSVPSWRSAGQQIETEVFESLSDQIAKFAQTGKFSFEELGASILATATEIIADKAVKELVTMMGGNTTGTGEGGFGLGGILSDLFGNGGSAGDEGDPMAAGFDGVLAGQNIMMAMEQGGMQAAAAIQQAMTMVTQQMSSGLTMGGAQASQQMTTGLTTGAATAAPTLSTSIVTGASGAAPILSAATASGGISGATIGGDLLGAGVEAGSETGGGTFASMLGGLFGGGGGGGGLGGLFSMLLPVLFGSGGGTTSGGPSMPSVMAPATMFKGAPSYASGTPNTTGGVPAILHDNEAVVPLTGGRKIPIEGGDASGGGKTIVQNFNISTPNADSFRKSQSQIAADAAASANRAMARNR